MRKILFILLISIFSQNSFANYEVLVKGLFNTLYKQVKNNPEAKELVELLSKYVARGNRTSYVDFARLVQISGKYENREMIEGLLESKEFVEYISGLSEFEDIAHRVMTGITVIGKHVGTEKAKYNTAIIISGILHMQVLRLGYANIPMDVVETTLIAIREGFDYGIKGGNNDLLDTLAISMSQNYDLFMNSREIQKYVTEEPEYAEIFANLKAKADLLMKRAQE